MTVGIDFYGSSVVTETHGMMTATPVIIGDQINVTEFTAGGTFTTSKLGTVNKGHISATLYNAAGERVAHASGNDHALIYLTPTEGASGDAGGSTQSDVNWNVNLADFATGTIVVQVSGKVQQALVGAVRLIAKPKIGQDPRFDPRSDNVSGNGMYTAEIPFSLSTF